MPTPPRRCWFQFGLRTMFVVVTLVGAFLAYHVNWMRQRHEALALAREESSKYPHKDIGLLFSTLQPLEGGQAPGFLWLLGEEGIYRFTVRVSAPRPDGFNSDDRAAILRSQDLFPEAEIVYGYVNPEGIVSLYWPDNGPEIFDPLIRRRSAN